MVMYSTLTIIRILLLFGQCIKLVSLRAYVKMHGLQNITFNYGVIFFFIFKKMFRGTQAMKYCWTISGVGYLHRCSIICS
jgi:hypothetical protein